MATRGYLLIFALLLCATSAHAEDWTMFRGPERNGISPAEHSPLRWGTEKNIKWKTSLPRPGNSSPVVVGDRVFVTCAQNSEGIVRSLYCFNRADGKQLWEKSVRYMQADPTHQANPYCGASPAADFTSRRVVAWFGSAGLHCYDFEGKPLWSRNLGIIRHIWGFASSPVIYGDQVFVNAGPGLRQFVAGIDLKTGDVLWQTDEPGGAEDTSPVTGSWLGSWSTPLMTNVDGLAQLLVFMPRHINAYDPKTGKIRWSCGGAGVLAYTDVLISAEQAGGGKIGIAMAGYGGTAIGFKLGGSGDVSEINRLWQSDKKPDQRIGSGVIVGQHIFVPNESYLSCMELKTGKETWRHRTPGVAFWGSIVKAGERLYVTSKQGVTYVFAPDPTKYTELAANDLGEPSNSTPAVSEGQLFLRTAEHLWCVEEH